MRVALTGAGGFTGRYVVEALADAGLESVALCADLADPLAIEREVADKDFAGLIHLAGRAFVAAEDWHGFYAVNQLGTFHLLEAVARHRPGVRTILASSAQVYGPAASGLVGEDAVPAPANHYAVSKLAMELGAARWRDRLDVVVVRPFNYSGVGQSRQYLLPKLVDHFRRRAPVISLGNTWVRRDFGDVRSVAEAYVGLIRAENVPYTLNIATGQVHALVDVLTTLAGLTRHVPEVRVDPAFVRADDVPVLGGDPGRLRATLATWRSRSIEETLAWMLAESPRQGSSNEASP